MTDEQAKPTDNENELTAEESNEALSTDDIDVEGALAALASLHDLTRNESVEAQAESSIAEMDEEGALEISEFERLDNPPESSVLTTGEIAAVSSETPPTYDTAFPRPPVSALHRGQLASVIPAFLLIGIGAYLTFALTTSTAIEPMMIVVILIAGLGLMLFAQWLSSARWAIGNFFIASSLLLLGGTSAYLLLPTNLSFQAGYPLLLTALGTSFVLCDIVVPSGRRIWLLGLILAIAGLAGLVVTNNLLATGIIQILRNLLPVALLMSLLVLIAPIFRRRSQ